MINESACSTTPSPPGGKRSSQQGCVEFAKYVLYVEAQILDLYHEDEEAAEGEDAFEESLSNITLE
jgi:hypothetical protein